MNITGTARKLRRTQTDAERALWQRMRDRQLHGYKFRRQMPVKPYIVDFACIELKLIVELDGSQHLQQKQHDDQRTRFLEASGYQVVRFWNNEVLKNMESVLESLSLTIAQREQVLKSSPEGEDLGEGNFSD